MNVCTVKDVNTEQISGQQVNDNCMYTCEHRADRQADSETG